MMQALLDERFHLQVHRETKEDKDDRNANAGKGGFLMEQRPMNDVASQRMNVLGQPVRSDANLKGVFTFSLTYSRDRGVADSNADPAEARTDTGGAGSASR